MNTLVWLAMRSLWSRRGTALLTVFSIAVSVALLLGVQMLRSSARDSFAGTISGTDLVVGARTAPVNLVLTTLFRIGEPTAGVSWPTYELVARHRDVAWTVPLSLGDSHRGWAVVGTTPAWFEHYRYAGGRQPALREGRAFAGPAEAVIGDAVARALGYAAGTSIVLAHGVGSGSFMLHEGHPVKVVGVLEPTGTPVDRALYVSLDTLEGLHGTSEPAAGASRGGGPPVTVATPTPSPSPSSTAATTPSSITAFLVGMKSRDTTLVMQRALNEYRGEALQAVIPGMALAELWTIVGVADRALLAVAACVAVAGLLGMLAALLTGLNERRREMAVLRAVGARPRHVFGLLLTEAAVLAGCGAVLGIALAYLLQFAARPWIAARFGIELGVGRPTAVEGLMVLVVVVAAVLLAAYPAWRAYRVALADGLTVRL